MMFFRLTTLSLLLVALPSFSQGPSRVTPPLKKFEKLMKEFAQKEYGLASRMLEDFKRIMDDEVFIHEDNKKKGVHPVKKQGVIQNAYLALLAKILAGSPFKDASGKEILYNPEMGNLVENAHTGWSFMAVNSRDKKLGPGSAILKNLLEGGKPFLDTKGRNLLETMMISWVTSTKGDSPGDLSIRPWEMDFYDLLVKAGEIKLVPFEYSGYNYDFFIPVGIKTLDELISTNTPGMSSPALREDPTTPKLNNQEDLLESKLEKFRHALQTSRLPGTVEDVFSFFDQFILKDLPPMPSGTPLLRHGIMQEFYLETLVYFIKGGPSVQGSPGPRSMGAHGRPMDLLRPSWTLTSNLRQGDPRGAIFAFEHFLERAPLDGEGLSLLKGFLLSFEGVSLADQVAIDRLVWLIEQKKPVDFDYSPYEYRSVYLENRPESNSFSYRSFNFNPDKAHLEGENYLNKDLLAKIKQGLAQKVDALSREAPFHPLDHVEADLNIQLKVLLSAIPKGSPLAQALSREGVVQEFYLQALTTIVRGGENLWHWEMPPPPGAPPPLGLHRSTTEHLNS